MRVLSSTLKARGSGRWLIAHAIHYAINYAAAAAGRADDVLLLHQRA